MQGPLLAVVPVPDVTADLAEELDEVERLFLAVHVDQLEQDALPRLVARRGQVGGARVVLHQSCNTLELALLYALVQPLQAIFRVAHPTLYYTKIRVHSSKLMEPTYLHLHI